MQTKAKDLYLDHFAKRLKERYNITLTDELYTDMLFQVHDSKTATFVSKGGYASSARRTIHRVIASNTPVYVVYAGKGAFVTALKPTPVLKGLYVVSTVKLGLPHGSKAPTVDFL
jgi:hypothetical protein